MSTRPAFTHESIPFPFILQTHQDRDSEKKRMSLRPGSRTEVRKKSYKTGVDADEARRRREDNLVEIRKNKREDNLLKKRREGLLLQSQQPLLDAVQNATAVEKRVPFFFFFWVFRLMGWDWIGFVYGEFWDLDATELLVT